MKTLSMRKKAIYEQEAIPFEEYNSSHMKIVDKLSPYMSKDEYLVPFTVVIKDIEPLLLSNDGTLILDVEKVNNVLTAIHKNIDKLTTYTNEVYQ